MSLQPWPGDGHSREGDLAIVSHQGQRSGEGWRHISLVTQLLPPGSGCDRWGELHHPSPELGGAGDSQQIRFGASLLHLGVGIH